MWNLSQPLHQPYSFFYFDVHLCFLSSPLQVWRLITNFLFFGPLGFSFLFNMIFLYPFLAVGRLWYVEEVCTQKHILRVSVCLLCITAVWLVCSCAVGVYALDWADIVTVECWRKALSAVERQILSICSCSVVFLWLYPSASITLTTTTTKNASLDQAMYHSLKCQYLFKRNISSFHVVYL